MTGPAHGVEIEMKRTTDGSQWQFRIIATDGRRISPQAIVDAISDYFVQYDPYVFEAIRDPAQDPDLH